MRWEYLSHKFEVTGFVSDPLLDVTAFEQQLAAYGEEGWELVSLVPITAGGSTRSLLATFKRPQAGK